MRQPASAPSPARAGVVWAAPSAASRRARPSRLLPVVAMLALVAGCLPLPDARAPRAGPVGGYRVDPLTVRSRADRIAGADEPATPDRYDAQTVVRWSLDEPVDTVVVAMPGLFGGALNFEPLARRMVAATPGLQVWAIDRRGNALEDREPVRAAMAARDPAPAIDAYLGRDGAPPSFRRPDRDDWGFVASWGLETHLRDLDAVITEARAAAPRVVLMGHSMGAAMAGVYAAWRTPDGPGHQRIDGLVLIDGAPGRTGAYGYERGFRVLGLPVVLPSREALEAGSVDPWTTLGEGGATFARRTVSAVLGAIAPEEDAPAGALPFRASNLAFAGLVHDDQYGAFRVFSASIGVATGAELDGNLGGFLLGGPWGARTASVVGVARGAERVDWASGDPRLERTDLDEYLATWTDARVDAGEWYVPLRLLQDLAALRLDLRDDPAFVPMSEVPTPTIAIGSDRGLLRDADAFAGYVEQRLGAPVSVAMLPGLTHLDLLTARDNPAVAVLARWLALLP